MNVSEAKEALDNLIRKSRVHLYKPIQIAEILYHDRMQGGLDLNNLETYRNTSKAWRNAVTSRFVGRNSNSSARYQDDLFNENAISPRLLALLGQENRAKGGIVEAYIYRRFTERFSQMTSALDYLNDHGRQTFDILQFINLFWHNPGLRRSIDKIYEITVFALFSVLVEAMEVFVTIGINGDKTDMLTEFSDFAKLVIGLSPNETHLTIPARIHRVGVTNAADRGLDMYANFGMAIQIKHLSLTPELAESIVGSVTADRIVIVCKAGEKGLILSLLNQIGWKARIQSIITENDLSLWYERALQGKFGIELGDNILLALKEQILAEFPASNNTEFSQFYEGRHYNLLTDENWT